MTEIAGGWLDGHFVQLGYQLADTVAATAYAFVVTYCLVALIDCVPGLEVRALPIGSLAHCGKHGY